MNNIYYKENWYALMIAVLNEWSIDESLRYMKVSTANECGRRAKNNMKYKECGEQCAILVSCIGMSYRGVGKLLGMDHFTVKRSINYYKEKLDGVMEN